MYIQAYNGLESIILSIFLIPNAFPRQWFCSALLTLSWQSLLRPELFYQHNCFTLKSVILKKKLI